ncbi:MAG: STAS domain-containing protein [Treponema sp.]|jgi:anti-anti-sigma factor|nr:STAS domain-containing protein [Treponema sp.]
MESSRNNSLVPGFDDEKDESLRIILEKIDTIDKCIRIYLDGYIDTYNSNIFQKRIIKVISAGYRNLLFSCPALSYVSSTGIGSFTTFLKMVKKQGGNIVLLELRPKVYDIFQLLGFAQYFNIKNSLMEALQLFKGGASAATVFPKIFSCPICAKKLKAVRSGRFRCGGCHSILAVTGQGKIFLG